MNKLKKTKKRIEVKLLEPTGCVCNGSFTYSDTKHSEKECHSETAGFAITHL